MTFDTTYKIETCGSEGTFGTYVVARDEKAAKVLIYDRGLGERIISWREGDKPSPAIEPTPAFFHWLTFLTFVAGRAGYHLDNLVGDGGIIHEVVHQLNHINSCQPAEEGRGEDWDRVIKNYKELLQKIGYGPPEKEEYPPKPDRAINYQI